MYGDHNNKIFINFASSCRSKKQIWEIIVEDGTLHKGQQSLKIAAVNHFKPFFEQNPSANLETSVSVASLFPHTVLQKIHFH
jgi:hypothetical protein